MANHFPSDQNVAHEVFKLRFRARICDEVAIGRIINGLNADDVNQEARRLRTQADLVEQGVPIDVAIRKGNGRAADHVV